MKEFVTLSAQDRTPEITKRAMEINRSIYRKMIEEACYQNQIAVDLFKSAKTPDMDLIKENKRYLYRDVNYIKDKKSRSVYLEEGIAPKGYSPVELLISQTNKYFLSSHLESRPISQFEDLFKGVEFTPQQKFTATLAKQEFDVKFSEAVRLKKRQETENGPYAIIKTPQGAQIEITNLTRHGHPGVWKAQTLNIKLEEIPETARSRERPHKLLAVAAIDGEKDENGQPVYRKLGTVSQQSAIEHKLKAGMTTVGATLVEIKPQISKSQTELLFQQAYEGAEAFYASIPESQRLSAAAAAWNVSTTRKDEGKMLNNSSETRESGDKRHSEIQKTVSNFIFAAFPNEIVSRLEDLQFTNIKLTGIGLDGDSFGGKTWNPDEKYPVEIRASHYLEEHERHASRLMFFQDSDGEYKEFGILEQRTGRLPIGTKADANITPGEAYTAIATLASPGNLPVEFTIREISKFSHAGSVFNGEQVTLSIGNVPVPDQTVKIKLDGKTLGELDTDSIKQLKEFNYLSNGNPLNLKFTSIGENNNEGAFIIGESPNGNLLRINKVGFNDFKGQTFNDKDYRTVTIETPTTKNRDAVFLNGEPLGVLHFKQDKEALKQLGFLKAGKLTPTPCTLQSNFSHTFVKVDPSTVQYPEVWTKESQVFKETTKQSVVTGSTREKMGQAFSINLSTPTINRGALSLPHFLGTNAVTPQEIMIEKSTPLLQKIKERPTILFASFEDKEKGLMGMAVDKSKVETVTQWLTNQNIEFKQVSPQEVPLEERKGLAVFTLVSDSIPSQTFGTMLEKFGKVLNSTPRNSEYYQRINSLHDKPQSTAAVEVAIAKRCCEAQIAVPDKLAAAQPKEEAEDTPPSPLHPAPQLEKVISGKPIPMNFPLIMHGETNPLPVDTCIDAMRGYGRTHTTRAYEPYKQYGFKEGDVAVAQGGGKQVAFCVGKQYQITQEMIADPTYQQQWALLEKHSPKELTKFKDKQHVWGLQMEPMGDYVDGKIVPFPEPLPNRTQPATTTTHKVVENSTNQVTKTKVAPPVNIGSRSTDPLGAALTNPTVRALELGNIQGDYPVSFRDNPAVPAGKYGPETYQHDKPKGVPFVSAEQAYQHYKEDVPLGEPRIHLMAEIIQSKLEQHPKLFQAIQQRGGVEWLENCTHYVTSSRDSYWEGKGNDSPFVRALIDGYSKVLEKSQTVTASVSKVEETTVSTLLSASPKTSNPLAELKPINDAVAHHMTKDVAMAEVATQFIGFSAAPTDTPSSTRNYSQAWGLRANTGVYSASDTIMVSGSGPWRGVSQQQIETTFKNYYMPLLDQAIASGSSFVVGNAAGTDQLVQQYLLEHGYKLEAQGDGYIRASSPELASSKVQDIPPSREPPPPTTPLTTTQNIPPPGVLADTVGDAVIHKNRTAFSKLVSGAADESTKQGCPIFTDFFHGSYEQSTVDNLRNWYSAVDKLGKSEEYKNRIVEVATEFKSGQGLSDRVLIAMNKDMEELRSINRLTQISQRICDVLGQPGEGGSIQVVGKTYDISLNSSQKDLTVSQKDCGVILDIKEGKIQTNKVSPDVIKNFEDTNVKLDTIISRIKSECREI